MVEMKLAGIKEMIDLLQSLKKAVTRTDFERAAEVALMPVRDTAERNVRSMVGKRTGKLHGSIVIKRLNPRQRRQFGYFGGMLVGADYKQAPHAHLVEYGTVDRKRKSKNGTTVNLGKVRPRPFLRSAYHAHRASIFAVAGRELGTRLQRKIDREIKKRGLNK